MDLGSKRRGAYHMRVVAFLQNCWFPPDTPAAITSRYVSDEKYRRIVLARSMTGKRLLRAFGPKYNEIWWDNASPQIGQSPGARFEANHEHMAEVIVNARPVAIICFGAVALDGLTYINNTLLGEEVYGYNDRRVVPHHAAPHPNARGILQSQLNEFADKIIGLYF